MRSLLRALAAAACLLLAPWPAAHAAPADTATPAPADSGGAVILMYHRFGEDRFPSTSIRLTEFEAHLAELRKPKYTVLPVPDIVEALRTGRPLPPHTVGITMDDAYRSIYTEAWPRLRAAGFPFTVFVSTDPLDRGYRDMMSWAELKEMVAAGGVTVGNHTASHPHMADASATDNRRELREAARRIAAEVGQAPSLFAYPYGEMSLAVKQVVQEEGITAAFGQQSGAVGPGMDALDLPRFAMNEHYGNLERFRLVVNALPLPVTDVTPRDRLLPAKDDPPLFGFTLQEGVGDPGRVTCYVSGQGRLAMKRIGALRLEGRPAKALGVGRSRINCTLPGPGGRWRWFGVQLYRPEGKPGS